MTGISSSSGPCVKIDPATLPQASNIHYLGMKKYEELPAYLSGWDVALLPFARNESTRVHQPDEDAGISRRRPTGRVDVGPRCGPAVRRTGTRLDRRRSRPDSSRPSSRRCSQASVRVARGGRSVPRTDVLGSHVGRDVPPDRRITGIRMARHRGGDYRSRYHSTAASYRCPTEPLEAWVETDV